MSNVKDSDMAAAHAWADAREELGSLSLTNFMDLGTGTTVHSLARKDPKEVFKDLQELIGDLKGKFPLPARHKPFEHLVIDSHMPLDKILVSARNFNKQTMLNNALFGTQPFMMVVDDVQQPEDVDKPFWDGLKAIKNHKRNEDRKYGHPNRKPQPNRGPVGKKDWK